MIQTLLRLLLAGRLAAAARERVSLYGVAAGAILALSLLAATGCAFLIAAAYQALELLYSGPVAAASIGLGLLLVAGVGMAVTIPLLRRKALRARRTAATADPSIQGVSRLVTDVLGDIPPTVAVAAIAGFLVGMFKR